MTYPNALLVGNQHPQSSLGEDRYISPNLAAALFMVIRSHAGIGAGSGISVAEPPREAVSTMQHTGPQRVS